MNDKQAALLILRALEAASVSRGRLLSRGRFSRLALRILWGRKYRPNPAAINDWLEPAGWTWMFDGETYFGVLRTSVIKDWPRISSSVSTESSRKSTTIRSTLDALSIC